MASSLSDVARHLNLTRPASRREQNARPRRLPALIFMTDARRTRDALADVLRLPPGAAVIYRHHELMPLARLALARILRAAATARRLQLLIADDLRLALAVDADGVHFSERALRRAGARLRKKPHWLVTAAAHSAPALQRAARAGADAALISPVFPTESHPGAAPLGCARFAALRLGGALPAYALGGIGPRDARRLSGTGAAGIAAIGGLILPARRATARVSEDRETTFLSFG